MFKPGQKLIYKSTNLNSTLTLALKNVILEVLSETDKDYGVKIYSYNKHDTNLTKTAWAYLINMPHFYLPKQDVQIIEKIKLKDLV